MEYIEKRGQARPLRGIEPVPIFSGPRVIAVSLSIQDKMDLGKNTAAYIPRILTDLNGSIAAVEGVGDMASPIVGRFRVVLPEMHSACFIA